ncbi:MAG: NAD(+) synthase [Christensenellales bacterium]
MKYGFLKVAACTPAIRVADCTYNGQKILELMKECAAAGVKLLVLPELCLTGYTCSDLFFQETLIKSARKELENICADSQDLDMVTILGVPVAHSGKLYNCAAVICHGKVLGFIPKACVPNYSEFYELRHFAPAPEHISHIEIAGDMVPFGTKLLFCCEQMPYFKFAVEICEDLWVGNSPSIRHAAAGATILANLSASNEVIDKDSYRRGLVIGQSAKLIAGYLYADAGEGESTTDLVFSGHDLIAQNGTLLAENKPFGNGRAIADLDVSYLMHDRQQTNTCPPEDAAGYEIIAFLMPVTQTVLSRSIHKNPFVPDDEESLEHRCEMILSIQSAGLRKRIEHTNAKAVVIGVSGGLDSTLALLVCARAMKQLGRAASDVLAVTMPCFGTTERTKSNAEKLCRALDVTLKEVDITKAVRQHFADIGHDEKNHSVVYENAQARERTQVLMDIAHQCGGFVVGTGDLSELALGWATYNGDHMSMYGVNASIPKTLVRYIVRYYADKAKGTELASVLEDVLDTPVSPELLPPENGQISQQTEQLVGPYELHDFFLYYFMRRGFAPEKIEYLANLAYTDTYSKETIRRWLSVFLKRFFANQFKRSCMPDSPKVGTVTLSPRGDWRMPSDASVKLWIDRLEQK